MSKSPAARLSMPEFISLMGMMFATVAFSLDAMLPAMTEIAQQLTPEAPNNAQLIITSFVLGMGIGTLFTGPLSDAFGRKNVIVGGAVLYIIGSVLAYLAQSLELVLAARILQGLGAAGPRVAALAIVRDLYAGREMARVTSFIMVVFTIVPAIAPLIGAGIIWIAGWRAIFAAFVLFVLISTGWLALRQPETLAPENRRPFRFGTILRGTIEILSMRQVSLVIAAQAFAFAILFTTLSTSQLVFAQSFDAADSFPYWYAVIAVVSGTASFLNAKIVVRMGMRRVITLAFRTQIAISAAVCVITYFDMITGTPLFALYILWLITLFAMAGLTLGNLNALGMEPLGHLAGLGASVIGSIATVGAVIVAIPIGLTFDGTPTPLAIGVLVACVIALGIMTLLGPTPKEQDTL